MSRSVQILVVLMLLVTASTRGVYAVSNVYVGSRAVAGRLVSMDQIDHSAWNVILRKYVDDNGMVAYRDE